MFVQSLLFLVLLLVKTGSGQGLVENHEGAHIALIGWTQASDGRTVKFDCTGSYLGGNAILTGARCLERDGVQADVVRLGEAIGAVRDFKVSNVTVHYRYQAEYYYHNMAIIFLAENPQQVANGGIYKPACIYSRKLPLDTKLTLIGRDAEGIFQRTTLEQVDSPKCHEFYSPTKKFKYGALQVCCMCARNADAQKCASELSSPMQLILEKDGKKVPFLVGQKTIGRSCGTNVPGIYTRLSSDGHLPWIETIAEINFRNHDACMDKY